MLLLRLHAYFQPILLDLLFSIVGHVCIFLLDSKVYVESRECYKFDQNFDFKM